MPFRYRDRISISSFSSEFDHHSVLDEPATINLLQVLNRGCWTVFFFWHRVFFLSFFFFSFLENVCRVCIEIYSNLAPIDISWRHPFHHPHSSLSSTRSQHSSSLAGPPSPSQRRPRAVSSPPPSYLSQVPARFSSAVRHSTRSPLERPGQAGTTTQPATTCPSLPPADMID